MSTQESSPGLTSSLTIHVVPKVDSQSREEGDEVDDEEPLFPVVVPVPTQTSSTSLRVLPSTLPDHSHFLSLLVPLYIRRIPFLFSAFQSLTHI